MIQQHFQQIAEELEEGWGKHLSIKVAERAMGGDVSENLQAERAVNSVLIDAALRSANASDWTFTLATGAREYQETTDPCSGRTFLLAALNDQLYLLEEIV